MTGLVRKATLLSACGLVLAGAAMAGVPSSANSQKPCILLMDLSNSKNNIGVNNGVCGQTALKVIIRDALNNPVANSDVVLDFSACGANPGPIMVGTTQVDPAVTVLCTGRTFMKTTNAQGEVCFTLMGNTNVSDPSGGHPFYAGRAARNLGPSAGQNCAKMFASGQPLGTNMLVIVNKYDLEGNGNVAGGDGSYHLSAQGFQIDPNPADQPHYRTFADYDCNGNVNAGDGSLGLSAQGNALAGELVYAGTYCP